MKRMVPDFADLKGLADAARALHEAGLDICMDEAESLGLYAIEWSLLAICAHKPSREDLPAWRSYLLKEVVGHMESDLGFTYRVVAMLSGMPREELEILLAEIGDSPIDRYRPKGGAE